MDIFQYRQAQYSIDDVFIKRWSPRSMSGQPLAEETLMTLFEAARFAPSSNNNQPWRFIYARRDTSHWEPFFSLLNEGNQRWAKNAAALVVVVSKKTFDSGKFARTHAFDTGAAWMSMALMGSKLGLVTHGMQGFDYDRAQSLLHVPDDYQVEAMIAVGRPGQIEDLPDDLREREFPSSRKPLAETVMEGGFAHVDNPLSQ